MNWPNADQIGAIATVISALAVFIGAIRLGRSKVKIDDVAELNAELVEVKDEHKRKWEERDAEDNARAARDLERTEENCRLRQLDTEHRLYEHRLRNLLADNGIEAPPLPDALRG